MKLQPSLAWRRCALLPAALAMLLAVGCAGTAKSPAPVEDRRAGDRGASPAGPPSAPPAPSVGTASPADPAKALPGAENAGKPGYYTVRPGDTLIRIGLDQGQNWRDIARWNNLDNPNLIEVGQVLRIAPPGVEGVAATRPVAPPGRVETRPLDPAAAAGGTPPAAGTATVPAGAPGASAPAPAAATAAPPVPVREPDDDVPWAWPAAGPVASAFDEGRNKGVAITGRAGDPVLAAADGRVVYAGSGLRGYGNLVIVKHNNTYLTAYAHNQALLVKEDQAVRRGQKIAEMGSTDADRVQLHFEIRRQGRPVDPLKLLPAR
jgi:lipoprotein NlpD